MVSDIESKTIDWLRFPCAFLVVVIHVFGYIGGGNISYQNGIYDCFRIAISQGFARRAVPIFFLRQDIFFFKNLKNGIGRFILIR